MTTCSHGLSQAKDWLCLVSSLSMRRIKRTNASFCDRTDSKRYNGRPISTAAPGIVQLGFSSGQDTSIAAFSPFLGAFDVSIKRKVLPPFV